MPPPHGAWRVGVIPTSARSKSDGCPHCCGFGHWGAPRPEPIWTRLSTWIQPVSDFTLGTKTVQQSPRFTCHFAVFSSEIGSNVSAMADIEAAKINHDNHLLLVRRRRHCPGCGRPSPHRCANTLPLPRTNRASVSRTNSSARTFARFIIPWKKSRRRSRTCSKKPQMGRSTAKPRPKMSLRTWI